MGIPKFFGWYRRNTIFADTITKYIPSDIDILSIDVNGLIHDNAQKVFKYGKYEGPKGQPVIYTYQELYGKRYQVYEGVYQDILAINSRIRPKRSLIIAIDGVAPQAKINQQRERRYKSAAERQPNQLFDSGSITPGTDFMTELDEFLKARLTKATDIIVAGNVKTNNEEKLLPPHIVYSNHLVPGEGEHKIADQLRTMLASNQTVAVYGADADLIMIYLLHLQNGWKNIFLIRETDDKVELVLNLQLLADKLRQLYPGVLSAVDDFVTILFLNGNDFLPHFPVFERIYDALDTLVHGYSEFLKINPGMGITSGFDIIWQNFAKYLEYIAVTYNSKLLELWGKNDDMIIKNQSLVAERCVTTKTLASRTETRCVRTFNVDLFKKEWYDYIFSPKGQNAIISPSNSDKRDMIHNYLEGLAWIYNYYRYGVERINKRWYYAYHYAPDFTDLYAYMKRMSQQGKGSTWEIESIHEFSEFISPLEQLVMVLSPKSIAVVPEVLRSLYTESSPIYDLLPESFLIDSQGKMEEWQSVALLPIPNPMRVILAVDGLRLNPDYSDKFKAQNNIVMTVDLERSYNISRGRGTRGRGRATATPETRGRGTRGRGTGSRARSSWNLRIN